MSECTIVSSTEIQPDKEICELRVSVVDQGVEVFAKSPVIEAFMQRISKTTSAPAGMDGYRFYVLPISFTRNSPITNMSSPLSPLFVEGSNQPNMVWTRAVGLGEGVTIVFPGPVSIPNDLIEYLHEAMEIVKMVYVNKMRRYTIKATLFEANHG